MNLLDAAAALFKELGWDATRLPQAPVITCALRVPNGTLDIYCHYHADPNRLLIYVRPQDVPVPEEQYRPVAEYLTRTNYGLPLGNFEIDLNDGEFNFKNSVDVNQGALTAGMVQTLIVFSLECYARYLPGIQAVIDGQDAKSAIETIDGPTRIQIR